MIFYSSGGVRCLLNLFKLKGSVLPVSMLTALPCALVAAGVRLLINVGHMQFLESIDSVLTETQAWTGFSMLVGFLIVFRTSQAYSRFWEGCSSTHMMRSEWFDCCSALCAFCAHSKVSSEKTMRFKHTLVRLFSMLHASALAELEELAVFGRDSGSGPDLNALNYELIDPSGIDEESLELLEATDTRVELIFQWVQLLVVENIRTGVLSIPAPILSRAFQELATGMVAFHDSVKLSFVPFPFPYAQNCDLLLVLHWCLAPFVFTQWVPHPAWAFLFVFIQVFVLWSLNYIAVEIENPYGHDDNDLDGNDMQREMNRRLLLLLRPSASRAPGLSQGALWESNPSAEVALRLASRRNSFTSAWKRSCSVELLEPPLARRERSGSKELPISQSSSYVPTESDDPSWEEQDGPPLATGHRPPQQARRRSRPRRSRPRGQAPVAAAAEEDSGDPGPIPEACSEEEGALPPELERSPSPAVPSPRGAEGHAASPPRPLVIHHCRSKRVLM
mmetsp:Transcript_17007/g.53448  ORF Transcript_17007/g.53448 Transcript_17007/m.53448 type:complete len:505 (+) Transcript_17007:147-1661(+)